MSEFIWKRKKDPVVQTGPNSVQTKAYIKYVITVYIIFCLFVKYYS